MAIQTSLNSDESELTIRVAGRFDFGSHHDFSRAYTERTPIPKSFYVDLADTLMIDSSALGMLLLLRDYASTNKSTLCIMNANETVSEILDVSCFGKLFDIR